MSSPSSPRRNVWVVDDSATDAERARRILASGYEVEVLRDGAAAVERLATGKAPDALVLDWVMPGMSGIDVCRFVRSSTSPFAAVKVLLLTAQRETAQIVEGLAAGADDYLPKPYADEEMRARVGALMRSRDLLERAERAEATARTLLSASPDALISWDEADGEVSFANSEALKMLGIPADKVIGSQVEQLLPELKQIRLRFETGEFLLLPDVSHRDRIYAPTARRVPSERGYRTILALRDVTERRQADARRLDFYSIIAHDLRSPLSAMLLRTRLMASGRNGPPTPGLLADIGKIEESVRSLVTLINDFLEFARLENTAYKLQRDSVNLHELAAAVLDELRPLAEAGKLKTTVKGVADGSSVVADRRRIRQVLNNLLGNAIKFTPPDGRIDVTVSVEGPHVEVAVSDTGHGIPEDALPFVFDRYHRVDVSDQTQPGTGLGLMIVREIVEAHGGSVHVESKIGVGSSFAFRLPRADRQQRVSTSG